MTYTPNFNDPRMKRKISKALDFVQRYVSSKHNFLSQTQINKYFGQGQLASSKWLRDQLLICVDHHWNMQTGKCKMYCRNEQGFEELRKIIGGSFPITPEESEELIQGEFEYKEISDRYWNTLQNIPSEKRSRLFADHGFRYNYDIKAAAPRLISQYARILGFDEPTPGLDAYLSDPSMIREEIAKDTGASTDEVKLTINALIHGSPLSHHWDSKLLGDLKGKHNLIDQFRSNRQITILREEFSDLWKFIKNNSGKPQRIITDKKGRTRSLSLRSRDKSQIYREIEKEVMNCVVRYLTKNKNKHFREHDGWRCQSVVDETELRTYVRNQTGYVIELSFEIYE